MKKTSILTLMTTLALMASLTACSIEDPSSTALDGDNADVTQTTPDSQSDSTPDEITDNTGDDTTDADRYELTATTEDAIRELSEDKLCEEFLKTLCNGNTDLLGYYTLGEDHSALEGFDAVYTINQSNTDSGFLRADVTLEILKSECASFEEGTTAHYELRAYEYGMPLIELVAADTVSNFDLTETLVDIPADGFNFAKTYMAMMFDPQLEYSNEQWKEVEDLNASIIRLIRATIPTNDAGAFSTDDLNTYLSQRFGYNTIDTYPQGLEMLNQSCTRDQENEDIYYTNMGMGGNIIAYTAREPQIDFDTNQYKYIFDLYTDFALLEKCGEVTFTFTLTDGSDILTLTDVAYTESNGRTVACIGV